MAFVPALCEAAGSGGGPSGRLRMKRAKRGNPLAVKPLNR